VPYRVIAERLLAEWREADRRLASLTDGSPEAEALLATIARIRGEYQRAVENARREHLPEPPPFPGR
jgi:hypothetical protein